MSDNSSQSQNGANSGSGVALPVGLELGHYRLLRKIGQGGFGITYLAEHMQSHEQVVIKENLPTYYAYRDITTMQVHPLDDTDSAENYAHALQRFVDEARTLAHLNHPNIVRVHEAFEALGTAYFVMPYIDGKELHKAAPAKPDEAWLLPILKTVLKALDYLHSQNLLHRDLKPGNILLQEDGTPILIDFGTARALQTERSATMVGTPGYTPLEQITPHGKRGPWTDIYALGATCYRVITGACPPQAVERIDDEDPYIPLVSRPELRARFSPALLRSIDKALVIRAKSRWQSAQSWLDELNLLTPKPSSAAAQIINDKTTKDTKEHPHAALLSLAAEQLRREKEQASDTKKKFLFVLCGITLLIAGIAFSKISYDYHVAGKQARWLSKTDKETAQKKLNALGIFDYDKTMLIAYNKPEVLKLLIAVGADVNTVDEYGWTPLHYATWAKHTECTKILLASPGIDVNKVNKQGETALYLATFWGVTESVELLLKAPEIDVNRSPIHGKTPLKIATERGHADCARYIRAAGGKM